MSTIPVLIPVEEYLNTAYRPDCDYMDGEVKERNIGELPHGRLQAFFIWYFRNHQREWRADGLPEQRVQVSASSYRIPDLCLMSHDAQDELIVRTPPLLCIEVLSREDRMSDILERIEDYLAMGVPSVWIVDPRRRKAFSVAADGILRPQIETLSVPDSSIAIAVHEVFAELDISKR